MAVNIGGGLLNLILKAAYHRMRPEFADPVAWEPTPGFPSGHAMGSVFCYGLLAYLLVRILPRWPRWCAAVALGGLVVANGFRRVYLGLHYLSDVVAAYPSGTGWVAIALSAVQFCWWPRGDCRFRPQT